MSDGRGPPEVDRDDADLWGEGELSEHGHPVRMDGGSDETETETDLDGDPASMQERIEQSDAELGDLFEQGESAYEEGRETAEDVLGEERTDQYEDAAQDAARDALTAAEKETASLLRNPKVLTAFLPGPLAALKSAVGLVPVWAFFVLLSVGAPTAPTAATGAASVLVPVAAWSHDRVTLDATPGYLPAVATGTLAGALLGSVTLAVITAAQFATETAPV